MSMKESMILGTAGLTAGMSVLRLTENIKPEHGKVVVSGATGGVGSLSIAILAKWVTLFPLFQVRKKIPIFYLTSAHAKLLQEKDFEQENTRPMMNGIFAGGIDTVGGSILDNIIKSAQPMGVVTCCGNVASAKLTLTVFPFILRGVSLIGIDSQNYPMAYRDVVWNKLAKEWKLANLMNVCTEISLTELSDNIDLMLAGKIKGRIVLDLEA